MTRLGHEPAGTSAGGRQVWYLSPFRIEKTPSFNINVEKNIWHDLGSGEGGSVIDFMLRYEQVDTVSEALLKLDDLGFGDKPPSLFAPKPQLAPSLPASSASTSKSGITLKKVQPLQNKALIQYLDSRGIPAAIARPFVQEAYYRVASKDRTYFGLAFTNASGGYEIRNAYFQGVIGAKDISLIEPEITERSELLIFEGFTDFLSALVHWKLPSPPASVMVLNSVAMKDKAIAVIRKRHFTDVRLYLDHDEAGRKLTRDFQAIDELNVLDGSEVYAEYKDFNAMLMKDRGLQNAR